MENLIDTSIHDGMNTVVVMLFIIDNEGKWDDPIIRTNRSNAKFGLWTLTKSERRLSFSRKIYKYLPSSKRCIPNRLALRLSSGEPEEENTPERKTCMHWS